MRLRLTLLGSCRRCASSSARTVARTFAFSDLRLDGLRCQDDGERHSGQNIARMALGVKWSTASPLAAAVHSVYPNAKLLRDLSRPFRKIKSASMVRPPPQQSA